MQNRLIGIIAAMDKEADGIKAIVENAATETVSGIEFFFGNIGNKRVVVAKSGVGKVFAAMCAQTMILRYHPDCIINTGIAGAVNEKLSILDTVVAARTVQHDMDTSPIGDPIGMISGINIIHINTDETVTSALEAACDNAGCRHLIGTIATGDKFVSTKEEKERIKKLFGGDACEMEGGAIGQVCYVNGVPFGLIRSISDGGDENVAMDYPTFALRACENSLKILLEFLKIF